MNTFFFIDELQRLLGWYLEYVHFCIKKWACAYCCHLKQSLPCDLNVACRYYHSQNPFCSKATPALKAKTEPILNKWNWTLRTLLSSIKCTLSNKTRLFSDDFVPLLFTLQITRNRNEVLYLLKRLYLQSLKKKNSLRVTYFARKSQKQQGCL